MKPTIEQEDVKNTVVLRKNLIVRSFAGTGKTSTTQYVIESICSPQSPVLYLTFAVSNVDEAIQKMGHISGLKISNVHKLAYASAGSVYQHKLGDMNLRTYKDLLKSTTFDLPKQVQMTITAFIQSTDDKLGLKHVPTFKTFNFKQVPIRKDLVDLAYKMSKSIWQRMIDVNDNDVKIPHDAYLKLYCQNPETLKQWLQYSTVIIDEGQDQSEQVVSLEKKYTAAGGHLVKFGDDNQNIYQFRNCTNGLLAFQDDPSFESRELTQSFRFGHDIAEAAKVLLKIKGTVANIKGTPTLDTQIIRTGHKLEGQRVVIHRTSAGVLRTAINLYQRRIPIVVVGGLSKYFTKELRWFEKIKKGDTSNLPKSFVKNYPNWKAVERIEDQTKDPDLSRVVRIIKMAESLKIGSLSDTIKHIDEVSGKETNPLAILTTIHKFKGLEHDQVILSDDFTTYTKLMQLSPDKLSEEINMLYVAITRAMKKLVANELLMEILTRSSRINLVTGPISRYG